MSNTRGVARPTAKATSYSSVRLSWSPTRLTVQLTCVMKTSYHLHSCAWPRADHPIHDWGRLGQEGRERVLRNKQEEVQEAPARTLGTERTTRALQPCSRPRRIRRGRHCLPLLVRPKRVRERPRPHLPRARRELLRL